MPSRRLPTAALVFALALTGGCSGDDQRDEGMQQQPEPKAMQAPIAPGETGGSTGATTGGSTDVIPPATKPDDDVEERPGEDAMEPPAEPVPSDGFGADGRIVPACQGLALEGMRYSPGGDTLPNECAPFDTVKNNPYAVRCIDAMPDFETPFADDAACILPPAPDQGFQVGVHPGGNVGYWDKMWAGDYSFYRDQALTAAYEIAAGEETVQNYDAAFDAPADERHYYRRQFRGRYGSHHGVVSFARTQVVEDRWEDNGDLKFGGQLMQVQNAHTDFPEGSLAIPPEEEGIGYRVSTTGVSFNLHHFNITDDRILRENWINVWYMPSDQVKRVPSAITSNLAIDYPIGTVMDNSGSLLATGQTQILNLYGHHHAWTQRFHAWIVRAGGGEELLYDSYDFWDMPTYSYNSVVENPAPGIEGQDGAASGPIVLEAGDQLRFNCHVVTTQERASELGVDLPAAPLRWGNQAFDAEMCVLLGQTTGAPLGGGRM